VEGLILLTIHLKDEGVKSTDQLVVRTIILDGIVITLEMFRAVFLTLVSLVALVPLNHQHHQYN